jgi:Flp pilus assembly protein TadD
MLARVVCDALSAPNLRAKPDHVTSADLFSSEPSPGLRGIARWALALVCVFLLLLGWRRDVLRDPPFFECVTGLYMEANFLAESNFDYARLRHQEKYVAEGGPYAYMTSVLPTMIALVMRSTSRPSDVFLVFHLFSIACASIVLVCAYALVLPSARRLLAAVCAAALATNPLFSAQIDMLGMDLPMTALAMVSATLLLKGWYLSAVFAGMLAFGMKPTGALVTVATIVYLFALLMLAILARRRSPAHEPTASVPRLTLGLLAAIAAFASELAIYRWGGINERLLGLTTGGSSVLSVWVVCPDLVLLGIAASLGTALLAISWLRPRRAPAQQSTLPQPAVRNRLQAIALCWLVIFGTMAAILRYGFVPPRYFTLVVPFLWVCIGLLLSTRFRGTSWGIVAVAVLAAVNLANWDGKFFPKLDEVTTWSRGGDRSRGYLTDLRSTIDAMQAIESQGNGAPIVAGHPYTYLLALPRMGYVAQPQRGYAINAFTEPSFPNWYRALTDKPASLIFVSALNHYYHFGMARIPPPEADDDVLFRSDDPSPLVVYRKQFSRDDWASGRADRWIAENTWHDPADLARSIPRAELLAKFGRPDLAAMLLQLDLSAGQSSPAIRLALGRVLAQAGQFVDAKAQFDAVLRDDPQNAEARMQQASLAELSGSTTLAERLYREVIQSSPQGVEARFRLAMLLLKRQDAAGALEHLQACVRQDPGKAAYRNALGVTLAQLGRFAEARQEFRAVLGLAPDDATAQANLRRLDELQSAKAVPAHSSDH